MSLKTATTQCKKQKCKYVNVADPSGVAADVPIAINIASNWHAVMVINTNDVLRRNTAVADRFMDFHVLRSKRPHTEASGEQMHEERRADPTGSVAGKAQGRFAESCKRIQTGMAVYNMLVQGHVFTALHSAARGGGGGDGTQREVPLHERPLEDCVCMLTFDRALQRIRYCAPME